MLTYFTNCAIIVLASLVFFFPLQPLWLVILTSCGTITLALIAISHEVINGSRTIEVEAGDWQESQANGFYFDVQRRFSNPTRCIPYIVGEDGLLEEAVFDVSRIKGGFRIKSNSPVKVVLEIS